MYSVTGPHKEVFDDQAKDGFEMFGRSTQTRPWTLIWRGRTRIRTGQASGKADQARGASCGWNPTPLQINMEAPNHWVVEENALPLVNSQVAYGSMLVCRRVSLPNASTREVEPRHVWTCCQQANVSVEQGHLSKSTHS